MARIWKALQTFAASAPVAEGEEIDLALDAVALTEESAEASEAVQPEASVPDPPGDAPVGSQRPDVAREGTTPTNDATPPTNGIPPHAPYFARVAAVNDLTVFKHHRELQVCHSDRGYGDSRMARMDSASCRT